MKEGQELSFSISDKLLGADLSPDNISLPLLSEFTEQVSSFLKGSEKIDLRSISASIEKGSLAIAIKEPDLKLEYVLKDYEIINKSHTLVNVDAIRAKIMENWQSAAKKNKDRIYKLSLKSSNLDTDVSTLVISADTNYKINKEVWLNAELYLYGKIYDLGGKNQPNVHIMLDSGRSIKVKSEASLLVDDQVNRLYSEQLIRLKAEQNFNTKEYRNEELISFENYKPEYDESVFQAMVKEGRQAWRDISSATQWVEELRGNYV
ncbi:hypothetical protein CVV43_05345 [Candidatus Saccharibacteria bacterium HGW-Saccharibacteria-1]|jgi:hypothetical protein|nr:MAG: hypothetical protein CVV43_05345 [Candidatus Saccharibacteria bacterium HGW-Saccharibacteria-1]